VKIPRTLGRYDIIDVIGQGGMGALYRARDPRIGRYVAIKMLRPGYDTPELRDRFCREARAAGCLSHPNIVTIYDIGEHDGLPFIAMEYVRGETFADLVCLRPPLPVLRKLQLAEEVCAGLAHAHEAGIVHRDIKPENLIVGSEGTVKILDFGIARLTASEITLPGAIMGTLNYMSPEQVRGGAVDARADIFSFGAVLYELLSHQPAFPGQLAQEVLHVILNGTPTPIIEYCPDIDPRLVRVIERALEKDPDRRFQTIASVQKELASIRLQPHAAVTTPPPAPTVGHKGPGPGDRSAADLRAQQVDEHLIAARRAFEARDFEAAIDWCKHVLMLEAADQRALSLLESIHAAIDEEQTAIHAAIAHARGEYEGGDLTSALRDVKQALALDPHNAEAQALAVAIEGAVKERQEEARIRAAVDDARRRFVKGDYRRALQLLEALGPTSHALVAKTLEELRLALREIEEQRRLEEERAERQRRVTALLAEAGAALKAGRLDDASLALERVREIDATVPELSGLTERVHRAQAAARLREELERTLGDFEAQLARGDLVRAGELLETAATLAPAEALVRSAHKSFDQAMAAKAAREAAEARRREGEQKIDEAAARLETGDLAGAGDLLKLAAELVPQHPRAGELSERLRDARERQAAAEAAERLRRQVEELICSASQRFQSAGDDSASELVVALRDVNQALALDPGNADAANLKTAIEDLIGVRREAARARAAVDNARRRFANGKHQAALRLLEDYQPPSRPEIEAALIELRAALQEIEDQRRAERERAERQQRVTALLAEARTALRDQQFDHALGFLSSAEEIDAAAPDLSLLKDQVSQEEAAARTRARLEQTLADLDEHLARGELTEADALSNAATALGPDDARVPVARRRVEQAIAARAAAEARARDVEEKQAAAESLFERGDLEGAKGLLTLAANLDPHHPRTALLSERVANAIRQREAAAAAEHLRRTIDELLAAAEQHLQSPDRQTADLRLAVQKVTQALALDPGHTGAQALKSTAEEALAAARETARVHAAIRNARSRFANGKYQSALELLEGLDTSAHPIVADTLKELRAARQEIEERQRAAEREHEWKSAGQRRIVADEEATVFIPPGTAAAEGRSAAEARVPPTTQSVQDVDAAGPDLTLTAFQTQVRIEQTEATARPWPRAVIIGAGAMLLAVLAALFLLAS
jgi:hypothetical protein